MKILHINDLAPYAPAKAHRILNLILCEYSSGETMIFPYSSDFECALDECRVAITSPEYKTFIFLRISMPYGEMRALARLTKEEEFGNSKRVLSLYDFPLPLQAAVISFL